MLSLATVASQEQELTGVLKLGSIWPDARLKAAIQPFVCREQLLWKSLGYSSRDKNQT